ncbi:MAG: hypothetical protein M1825_003077 [Sarcosagium campestre]|nr:MAG: hypothetical protein M1825_003077 [Sarcosagium campestre]
MAGNTGNSYEELAARFAKAKSLKEKEDTSNPGSESGKGRTDEINSRKAHVFKASHALLVSLFSWICLLHVIGIFLFTKGFLLTRLVLDQKSECGVLPSGQSVTQEPGSADQGCWHPKTFDKAVVIIIDALRYDFTIPYSSRTPGETTHHFHNAFSVLYDAAVQQPQNAILLPFIADPPTATLQRLKGLTTGTLPTFVDVGSNFAGTAIEEDNIVAQLRTAGKNLVHLGDDTWHSLFPGYFDPNLTHAYESFNVWDLHTVDDGVTEHILPLLHPDNTSRWDVIFGHYLGVDHAGHRYGPDHPAMTAKLDQMDGVIRQIANDIDDTTLLVVMGDHGMDAKGDHGGESDDEIEAALWMYSKMGIFGRSSSDRILPPASAKERPVNQIDLVPTLSLLLGIPIPFNNLGAPIEEAFIGRMGSDFKNLAAVNRLTSSQIHRYQNEYFTARSQSINPSLLFDQQWEGAQSQWQAAVQSADKASSLEWKELSVSFSTYQKEILSICKSLWARFDIPSMVSGILILAGSLITVISYASGSQGDTASLNPLLLRNSVIGALIGAVGAYSTLSLLQTTSERDGTLFGFAAGAILGLASAFISSWSKTVSIMPTSIWGWLAVTFTIGQSIGFASNSYTIWEDEILLFFISSFGCLAGLSSLRLVDTNDRYLGVAQSILFVVLTRISSLSRLCREEQMPWCKSTYYASANSSTSALWQLYIPFIVALALPDVIKSYYKGTRSYEGSAIFWIGFAFRVGLVLSAIFWTLDAADDGNWFNVEAERLKTARMIIARIVLAIAFAAGTSTYAWASPCVNVHIQDIASSKSSTGSSPGKSKRTVTILGYANLHGSRFFLLVTNIALAILLLTKPMGHLSLGVLIWQILALLEIIDTNSLSHSAIGPVMLGLLGNYHFFKTGHQATLSSIQWESAFVPLRAIRYPWSPLLVIGNTFAAQIICTVAVPLVGLWKQPAKQPALLSNVGRAMATHVAYHATINLATTMWAAWLRRHLMLFRIFSPRWMVGAAVLLVCDVFGALVAVAGVRWSAGSIGEVFGWP